MLSLLEDMKGTDSYEEDWIGLRELDKSGRLELSHVPGPHMPKSCTKVIKWTLCDLRCREGGGDNGKYVK